MTLFDIPVGFASVFGLILMGYLFLTMYMGAPPQPVAQKVPAPRPLPEEAQRELAG